MSTYDDSSQSEEQPEKQNQPSMPAPINDFEHYPFLPPAENPAEQESQATGETNPQDPPRRLPRILTQALLTLALVVLAFWAGWFAHQLASSTFDLSNQSHSYAQLIQQAWTDIDQNYVDRSAVDYKKMSYAAINAMVNSLGDTNHSRFMDAKAAQDENQQLSGKITGIGVDLGQNAKQQFIILAPIPDSPAERAGLKSNDIILSVNGTDPTGKDLSTIRGLIQGPAGTTVTLVIQRPGEDQTLTITITRAEFAVPNVFMHYTPETHTVDIQVVQFAAGVSDDVQDDVTKAKAMGATKIILDLRKNPGGYLTEAEKMSSLFLKSGKILIQQDSTGQRTPIYATGNPIDTTSTMVVLANRDTGSAAEIVTAALKENNRATVIGETTFGTGTVLTQYTLADGSVLLLGTEEWLTPDGNFIRQVANDPNSGGIKPTTEIPQDPNQPLLFPNQENQANMSLQQILASGDAQLVGAIQYLNSH